MTESAASAPARVAKAGEAEAKKDKESKVYGYALLVGINRYDHFPGESLEAGHSDVLAFWKVCRRLKFRPHHITVLASPPIEQRQIVSAEMELFAEGCPTFFWEHFRAKPEEVKNKLTARVEARRDGLAVDVTPGEIRKEAEHFVEKNVRKWFAAKRDGSAALTKPFMGATRAELAAGVAWLAEQLARSPNATAEPSIFTFSGHGAKTKEDGLALCPSDVRKTGEGLVDVYSFSDLEKAFEAPAGPGERVAEGARRASGRLDSALTIFLDCCFAASSKEERGGKRVSTLTPDAEPAGSAVVVNDLGSRVLCASERGEPAHQFMLNGRWHSAFTWACTTLLERWPIFKPAKGKKRRTSISHGELLLRTRLLLEVLDFPQRPRLLDTSFNSAPVFWYPTEEPADFFRAEPRHGETRTGQMDPTGDHDYAYYELRATNKDGLLLAQCISVNNASAAYGFGTAQTEYWKFSSTQFDTGDYDKIWFGKTALDWKDKTPAFRGGDGGVYTNSVRGDWAYATQTNAPSNFATNWHYLTFLDYSSGNKTVGWGFHAKASNGKASVQWLKQSWTGNLFSVTISTVAVDGGYSLGKITADKLIGVWSICYKTFG